MTSDYSRESVLHFLDYLGSKGLMKRATVGGRKAAANALLGILSDEEASDLSDLNMDELVQRFSNLKGREFKPQSLSVYKSRLRAVLDDFENYRKNPLSFRPGLAPKERRQVGLSSKEGPQASNPTAPRTNRPVSLPDELIFPIPLRDGVVVRIACIPSDLTAAEARKIANVVLALATKDEARE